MPKSKLRSSMSIDEIDSIQATREEIDIETVTVNNRLVKRPVFSQVQFNPNFRGTGSVETDEVEYDSYVKWAVAKFSVLSPFVDVNPSASQVVLEIADAINNFSIPFGNPIDVDWPSGTYTDIEGNNVSAGHLYQGILVRSQALTDDWVIEGDLSVYVYDTAGTNIGHGGQVVFGVGDIDSDFIGICVYWMTSRAGCGYQLSICRYDDGSPSYSEIVARSVSSGPIEPPATGLIRITKEGTKYTVEFNSSEYGYHGDSKTFASEQEVYVMSTAYNSGYSILEGLLRVDNIQKVG
ncbi:MAG: hypothetical protein J7J61_06980 [Candidatus Hydrothermae bacterium]|nr:hypothetical protein [Candidatus Hydrothermae bacterium]